MSDDAYALAGVDIAAGRRATELMKEAVRQTFTPAVLSDVGHFGGLFDVSALQGLDAPVLVASTDGVGTKTAVAARLDRWETIGQDLVNHCVNDIVVQGARPLFFLDYVASSKVDPTQIATIVGGMAAACRAAGCALLGGETAEMPGVYQEGAVDVVGTVVGVVEREKVVDGRRIQAGDALLALPSSGLHTNGFTLARQVLAELDWQAARADWDGVSVGDALLAVHRSYLEPVQRLARAGIDVRGLAHITGGGVVDNLPRILAPGLGAVVRRGSWPEPPIFPLIQQLGDIPAAEMFHIFNMGLGMVVVVPAATVAKARAALDDDAYVVGHVETGQGVRLTGL